jgi:hypothetical protein
MSSLCGDVDKSDTEESISVYNTFIKNSIAENVFKCLTKTTTSPQVTEYFVSKEHNVSDEPPQYAAGRFIFKKIEENFYYEALAEEPAKIVVKEGHIEKVYLEMKDDHERGKNFVYEGIFQFLW